MKSMGAYIERFLNNTKFGMFYNSHRLFRYIINLLALAVMFVAIHIDIYHLPENSFVLYSIVSLVVFVIVISLSSVTTVRFKKKTEGTATLSFIISAIILFILVGINLWIGCPNYVPPAPEQLPIL